MEADALKKEAFQIIDDMRADLLEASHAIHQKPELAFEERFASDLLASRVEAAGLPITRGAYGLETAYLSSFGDGSAPEVAILSEYDALPVIGHACGHNIIATAGLGAALALARLGGKIKGRVRYIGAPAEEGGGGKELMARQGAFDGVDAAMMVHPAGLDLRTMPSLCVSDVSVVYHGRSAHASAMPHEGLNALDGVITAYQAVAQLRQHIRSDERVHGIITEGGYAANIVPERAAARFYVRAGRLDALMRLRERVEACFDAGARATGTRAALQWQPYVAYLDVKHNEPLTRIYEETAVSLGREMFPVEKIPPAFAGSTDMGNVSHRVPSIHPMISCAPPSVVIHNPEFARHAVSEAGDLAVLDGAKCLVSVAISYFCDGGLRDEVGEDFARTASQSRKVVEMVGGDKHGH